MTPPWSIGFKMPTSRPGRRHIGDYKVAGVRGSVTRREAQRRFEIRGGLAQLNPTPPPTFEAERGSRLQLSTALQSGQPIS
jgi:hypothetical protein